MHEALNNLIADLYAQLRQSQAYAQQEHDRAEAAVAQLAATISA